MRPRHEFQLGELTVSYLIAQWHENDGERYDPFPEGIKVNFECNHCEFPSAFHMGLMTYGPIWDLIVEKCREDMLDRL